MKYLQHVPLESGWPEHGVRMDGTPIRLADVEDTYPANSNERSSVYFFHPTKPGVRVYPWKEAGYAVDDGGTVLSGAGPLPMSVKQLAGMGLTDEVIFAEHAAYYPEPAVMPHPHDDLDSPEAQRLRRRVFDEVCAAWYADPSPPRLHGA